MLRMYENHATGQTPDVGPLIVQDTSSGLGCREYDKITTYVHSSTSFIALG
jgi:hypothetical protein